MKKKVKKVSEEKALQFFRHNYKMIFSLETPSEKGCAVRCLAMLNSVCRDKHVRAESGTTLLPDNKVMGLVDAEPIVADLTREVVLNILDEKVQDVFNMCQDQLKIPSGDITPELQLMLDDKVDQLGTLIWSILQYQLSITEG